MIFMTKEEIKLLFKIKDSTVDKYEDKQYFKSIKIKNGQKLYELPDYFDTDIFKSFKEASLQSNIPLHTIYKWTYTKRVKIYMFFGKKFVNVKELQNYYYNNKNKIDLWKKKCGIWKNEHHKKFNNLFE